MCSRKPFPCFFHPLFLILLLGHLSSFLTPHPHVWSASTFSKHKYGGGWKGVAPSHWQMYTCSQPFSPHLHTQTCMQKFSLYAKARIQSLRPCTEKPLSISLPTTVPIIWDKEAWHLISTGILFCRDVSPHMPFRSCSQQPAKLWEAQVCWEDSMLGCKMIPNQFAVAKLAGCM